MQWIAGSAKFWRRPSVGVRSEIAVNRSAINQFARFALPTPPLSRGLFFERKYIVFVAIVVGTSYVDKTKNYVADILFIAISF